ncbi:hypothetical protein DRO58_08785 [Candidatus Bathyarchaeota archaeon]|nr:MAG: hypothetical protein DRO58_08785 [Candidatus Bathyarchaeota archaeon]
MPPSIFSQPQASEDNPGGGKLDLTKIRLLVDKGWYRLYEDEARGLWFLEMDRSPAGYVLKCPVGCWFKPLPGKLGLKLVEYVAEALFSRYIPQVLTSRSLMKLVNYLYRYRSQSCTTLDRYVRLIAQFLKWVREDPDRLVAGCFTREGLLDQKAVKELAQTIDLYLGELQAEGLASQTIASTKAALKTWLEINGITLPRIPTPRIRHNYSPRAPTPDELAKVLEIGDLRAKTIISILALSGMRVSTLARLKLKHLEPDLSRGVSPVCINVPAELNKGQFCSYFTFIGEEAVRYLKLYLEQRRLGTDKIPPEQLTPESPVIRTYDRDPRPVSSKQLYYTVSRLFRRAGLLREPKLGRRYRLCAHSLRKYFKTQLAARGVPPEFVEFMMGHKTSTYLDVRSKGVEFLRSLYAASGISIKPQTRLSKIEVLKELVRSLGFRPEEVLVKHILEKPHRTLVTDDNQLEALREAIRHAIRKEIVELLEE